MLNSNFVLVILIGMSLAEVRVLYCTGKYSALTYDDCQTNEYYKSSGCFYVEHFSQYRACSRLCNGVVSGSIAEEKCKAFCGEYYESSCIAADISGIKTASPLGLYHYFQSGTVQITTDAPEPTHVSLGRVVTVTAAGLVCLALIFISWMLIKQRVKPAGNIRSKDVVLPYMRTGGYMKSVEAGSLSSVNYSATAVTCEDEDERDVRGSTAGKSQQEEFLQLKTEEAIT